MRVNQESHDNLPVKVIFWAVFLVSGACGLIYEILWVRFFSLAIGSTIYAASAVTAAYMGGLAAGAWFPGRLADGARSPLKWYAAFELLIGVYGLIFLALSPGLDAFSAGLGSVWQKFFAAMAALAVPTVLMGATLPFVAAAYVRIFQPKNRDFSVSVLYGINAFGGVAGIFLSGFYLLQTIGCSKTTIYTAIANFIVAAAAYCVAGRVESGAVKTDAGASGVPAVNRAESAGEISDYKKWLVFGGFFMVGFAALALEIIWTRLLVLVIGTSTYAFSIILMAYICGIPLGTIAVPALINLFSKREWRSPKMEAFGVVLMTLGIASLLTVPLISAAPFIFLKLFSSYHSTFTAFLFYQYLLCLMILLVPATLSGYAFTCALGAIKAGRDKLASDVGRLYFFNTIGSVAGAMAAPFILIKNFGLQNSIIMLSTAYLLSGLIITMFSGASRFLKVLRASTCAAVFLLLMMMGFELDMDIIASGVHYHPEKLGSFKTIGEIKKHIKKSRQIFLAEGVDSTVGIYSQHGVTSLKINGKTDASTGWYDMNTQLLLGHLPMMLCKHPENIAIIGLGAGVTTGAVMKHNPKSVDCIEISPNVIQAARYFTKISELDFSAPNLSIIEDDALSFMKTSQKKYNVIISEPSNPWIAGIASLFTIDHFAKCRERLAPGGIICQWLQLYSMSNDDFIKVLVTFHKIFPNSTLWLSSWGDALIIASRDEFEIDLNVLNARFNQEGVRKHLNLIEIFSVEALLAHQILDGETLRGLSAKYPGIAVNSHDVPSLEYSAPANYYVQNSESIVQNLHGLQKKEKLLLKNYFDAFPPGESSYESLARAYYKLKFIDIARQYFKLASDKNPALWFMHLKKAEQLYNEKLLFEAINEIQVAMFLAPEKRESYFAFLKVAVELQDFYSIIRVFKEAEKYFEGIEKYQYYLALGVGYEGIDETADAIICYKKAIDIFDDCFSAHKNLGLIYYKSNDIERSAVHLRKAHKLKPDDAEIIDILSKFSGGK